MNKKENQYFKGKLVKEREDLISELKSIGKVDKHSAGGWEATSGNMEVDTADENELADKLEELEDNEGILGQLEKQLEDVDDAIKKIDNGNYGKCEVCNEPIEKERLEANPSAKTCKQHIK